MIVIGTAAMGFYSVGETRLNFKYSMGKWEFVAKNWGGVNGWKITKRKNQE